MPVEVAGPAWSKPGLDLASSRYPLRVETHVGRLVQRLLPGVITTTYQARTYALHGLVWMEIERRGLDLEGGRELLRRCEVVLAAISLQHDDHLLPLPEPHGGDKVAAALAADGYFDLPEISKKGRYTESQWGFASAYMGSETLLGIAGAGRPPAPGERVDGQALREALGTILELADEEALSVADVAAHPELCICGAAEASDGAWLRQVFLSPPASDSLAQADLARCATARLLGRVVSTGASGSLQDAFRQAVAFGDFLDTDPVASSIGLAQAWRGVILRNYSVGAWRRAWSWIVDQLGEPCSPGELGRLFADELPDVSVDDFVAALPERVGDSVLLPAEETVRGAHWSPHPTTELQLLALGGLRLDDLEGRALEAFVGNSRENDLGPRWFRDRLDGRRSQHLREFGAQLVEDLVLRAWRVALSKTELRPDGTVWLPSRIREREGLVFRQSTEGWGDVALRIDSLANVLIGIGVIAPADGTWELTDEGAAVLA